MISSATDKINFIEKAFGRGVVGRNGKNITVRCPITTCDSRKDRGKKKLSIRIEDDASHCWVCGWASRSLAPLLIKYCDESLVHEYRERFNQNAKIPEQLAEAIVKPLEMPSGYRFLMSASKGDPDVLAAWKYIFDRGLREEHVWRFKLGVSDDPRWKRRVIALSHDANGKLNYYVGRALSDRMRPKYDTPDNVKSIDVIYNEVNIDWGQRLTLCEGPFDLMKCNENATCLLGSYLSEKSLLFNSILLHGTPVLLALDNDMRHKTLAYAKKLNEYNIDVRIMDLGDRHDPGEMSQQEFIEMSANSREYTWLDSFKQRLEMA